MTASAAFRSVLLAALVVIGVAVASTQAEQLDRHEASVVLSASNLDFNTDRFSRVMSALLRSTNDDTTARRTALPIEGTQLVLVTVRGPDSATAIADVEQFATTVLETLQASTVADFERAGEPQVVRVSRQRSMLSMLIVGGISFVLLSMAFAGLTFAWTRPVDESRLGLRDGRDAPQAATVDAP